MLFRSVLMSTTSPVYDQWKSELANSGMVVVGVEFRNAGGRLGPHPFPAGLNDCVSALRWMHENRDPLNLSGIVISGESGGGNLAIATCLKGNMAYSKKVIDKFESTLNEPEKNSVGRWNPSDTDIGTGMVGAPACGDVMRLQIKCKPKNNSHVISDVKFKTYGCGSAIASSSELVDMLVGKTLEEAREIKNKDIANAGTVE